MAKQAKPPKKCDLCNEPFVLNEGSTIYDAKTNRGPWAWMCTGCMSEHGVGLGTGRGQRYEYNSESQIWEMSGG